MADHGVCVHISIVQGWDGVLECGIADQGYECTWQWCRT